MTTRTPEGTGPKWESELSLMAQLGDVDEMTMLKRLLDLERVQHREAREAIAAAVPPPGCIIDRDADGKAVVRKVLGTLPLTADGCVCGAMWGAWAKRLDGTIDAVRHDGLYWCRINEEERHEGIPPFKMYSTREAAYRAAKEKP